MVPRLLPVLLAAALAAGANAYTLTPVNTSLAVGGGGDSGSTYAVAFKESATLGLSYAFVSLMGYRYNDTTTIGAIAVYECSGSYGLNAQCVFHSESTIFNPLFDPTDPAVDDNFGQAFVVDGNLVFVAATAYPDDEWVGLVQVFDCSNPLACVHVGTMTNPDPAYGYQFGNNLAALASNGILVTTYAYSDYNLNETLAIVHNCSNVVLTGNCTIIKLLSTIDYVRLGYYYNPEEIVYQFTYPYVIVGAPVSSKVYIWNIESNDACVNTPKYGQVCDPVGTLARPDLSGFGVQTVYVSGLLFVASSKDGLVVYNCPNLAACNASNVSGFVDAPVDVDNYSIGSIDLVQVSSTELVLALGTPCQDDCTEGYVFFFSCDIGDVTAVACETPYNVTSGDTDFGLSVAFEKTIGYYGLIVTDSGENLYLFSDTFAPPTSSSAPTQSTTSAPTTHAPSDPPSHSAATSASMPATAAAILAAIVFAISTMVL